MVEFHRAESEHDSSGRKTASLVPGRSGWWMPYPVEYKRGRPKGHSADEVQLCAQAMCLEEMLDVFVPEGALFYGEVRRRTVIVFTDELRSLTQETANSVHALIDSGVTPPPEYGKQCEACSLIADCCPREIDGARCASEWFGKQIEEAIR